MLLGGSNMGPGSRFQSLLTLMMATQLLQSIQISCVMAATLFHDDFTSPPDVSGKWLRDATRLGTGGDDWGVSQTSSAMLLAGKGVWTSYTAQSWTLGSHGNKITVEAVWSASAQTYMDEDFWIGVCSQKASPSSPARSNFEFNLPYANCVAGEIYDTAASDTVTSKIYVPNKNSVRGGQKCNFKDGATKEQNDQKALVTQSLTLDATTGKATLRNSLGCSEVTIDIDTLTGDNNLAEEDLWVYFGADANFLTWLEVEHIKVMDASDQVLWQETFSNRKDVDDDWFSHEYFSKACPGSPTTQSAVAVTDGFLEVRGQTTMMEAMVSVPANGGDAGTIITLEVMPDYLAPVLVDNDVAILVCEDAGIDMNYRWTKDSVGNCLKFMFDHTNMEFSKRLAMPGQPVIGGDGGYSCSTDHFVRLRVTMTNDTLVFEDSAGCSEIRVPNPWSEKNSNAHVFMAWDEQTTYWTTMLDFKVETWAPSTNLNSKDNWIFSDTTCDSQTYVYMWLGTQVCSPATNFIGSIGSGIVDGECHWGESVSYMSLNLDVYYRAKCAADGSGVEYLNLYVGSGGTRCGENADVKFEDTALGSCAHTQYLTFEWSLKIIGDCPVTEGESTVSVVGSIGLDINTDQMTIQEFLGDANVADALRIAVGWRTSLRPELVEIESMTDVGASSTEGSGGDVIVKFVVRTYGTNADATAAEARTALLDRLQLQHDINQALRSFNFGSAVVSEVRESGDISVSTPPPPDAVDAPSTGGDDDDDSNHLVIAAILVVVTLVIVAVCVGLYIWKCRRPRPTPKPNTTPEPPIEENNDVTGAVVVGRPVSGDMETGKKAVDGVARPGSSSAGAASSSDAKKG